MNANIPQDPTFDLYRNLVEPQRLVYPKSPIEEQELLSRIIGHHSQGGHIAIVDGAFDVPHDGHPWYLRGCRLEAARRHFGDEFDVANRLEKLDMVASASTMLIVTVDADHKVAWKKGNKPEKGSASRPVYPWEARANTVGSYTIPDSSGTLRPIVDIVTVEGDPDHKGTALESHLEFGYRLHELGVLGTWLIYSEHGQTALDAKEVVGEKLKVVSQEAMRVIDPRTGRKWSSSDIIRRIKED